MFKKMKMRHLDSNFVILVRVIRVPNLPKEEVKVKGE